MHLREIGWSLLDDSYMEEFIFTCHHMELVRCSFCVL